MTNVSVQYFILRLNMKYQENVLNFLKTDLKTFILIDIYHGTLKKVAILFFIELK